MSEFAPELCPTCPIRGECRGPIDDVEAGKLQLTDLSPILLKRVDRWHSVGKIVDVNGGYSELFREADITDVTDVHDKVETCLGPENIITPSRIRFIKPRIVKVCGALGVGPASRLLVEYYENAKTVTEPDQQ